MKKMFSNMRRSSYTMIEMIVALGVFSIMLLMMMQFFTSAQNAWSNSESRSRLYSDSRVVFDLVANAVKAAERSSIATPSGEEKISCTTTLVDGSYGAFSIKLDADEHQLQILKPQESTYAPLITGVIEFTAVRWTPSFVTITGSDNSNLGFIFISMKLLNPGDLPVYKELSGDAKTNFVNQRAASFVRVIAMPR